MSTVRDGAAVGCNKFSVRFLPLWNSINPMNRRRKATWLRIVKVNIGDLRLVKRLRARFKTI